MVRVNVVSPQGTEVIQDNDVGIDIKPTTTIRITNPDVNKYTFFKFLFK